MSPIGCGRLPRYASSWRVPPAHAESDAHPATLDFQFGQMVAFQQIRQLLNLRGLVGIQDHLVGRRGSWRKGARQHNGLSGSPAFSGLLT